MALELKNITKKFGQKVLFCNLSFTFPDCGTVVLCGESGSGKTTLLRMICGLTPPDEGEILGGGIGRCAVAFQEYRLFPTVNALENVLLAVGEKPGETERENAIRLLTELRFTKADLGLFPGELSGGMKQRISLARALISDLPLLLLDEPFKELDVELRQTVARLIRREAERRTVIFTSHSDRSEEFPDAILLPIR